MSAVVILNIVFAVLVVGGIVSLLGRAIFVDNPGTRLALVRRPAPTKPARSARRALRSAYDYGA